MQASPVRDRSRHISPSGFGDSVFRSQILLAGAVGLSVCVTVALSDRVLAESAAFFFGLTALLWVTIASAVVPWLRIALGWQMIIPLLDIAAIALLRLAVPESGFGVLMIFPVIWLATSFGRAGYVAGPALTSLILLPHALLVELDLYVPPGTPPNTISAISLSVTLAFVAGVTHAASRRVESQRVLLRRQTQVLEKALRRARRQEATLREAFDAVEFAVISLDRNGRTMTSNRASRSLLNQLGLPESTPWHRFPLYRADKITPLPLAEFPHLRLLAGETVENQTYCIGHRTGTRFTIDVSARLLRDDRDEIDRVVVVLRDVSAEVRAITDRDDLVTSMSHELRTPLSSVLGYVDLALESDGLPAPTREMLEVALTNAQRLNSLVNDLLAARSTSPSNAIALRPSRCDVSALVHESVDAIRPLSAERLISIQLDITDHVHAQVDAFRLRQVIDNLLSNAVKYNRSGGRITVATRLLPRDGDTAVEIRVADTGRGMTLEEQKGLFERFYRAESVRGSTMHGTGLGLSISRDIVVRHGGTIEVDSAPDRGTEVVVTVPQGIEPMSPFTVADRHAEES
ncbi:sensor histidine kinase [Aeromicrobium wangtongii]|uniref:sensor histidine kinase n=1 Tax=Aeromicrobium wangtongii TaxID=2969247 RepID=UPI002017E10F|nr:sensor histidine kinase [Aeromicrobium wangtongii]MCL3817834.1 HAMP domain-containing histidine kinase [Aeromicrobium wangtongii]